MVKANNPVGRLYNILEAAKAASPTVDGFQTWTAAFGIPGFDGGAPLPENSARASARALTSFFKLTELVDQAEAAIRSVEGINLNLYLTPFTRIRGVLSVHRLTESSYPQTILGAITEGDMALLALGAEVVEARHSEGVIEEEELKDLAHRITVLYEDIKASAINETLRNFILDQLMIIKDAIHQYRVGGIKRLQEGLYTAVGAYILNEDLLNEAANTQEVKDYKQVLGRFASMVSFASNAVKLLEAAGRYIPPLLPGG